MKLTETQKAQLLAIGGNLETIEQTENGDVDWDWEMVATEAELIGKGELPVWK